MRFSKKYSFKFSSHENFLSDPKLELENIEEVSVAPLVMMDENEKLAKLKKARAKKKIVEAKDKARRARAEKLKAATYRRLGITGSVEEKARKYKAFRSNLRPE